MKTQNLEAALGYCQKGYSVIPVGPDKRPLISWKDHQEKKATMDEVIGWWKTFPDALIGIVTGPISDLTVIDVEEGGDFGVVTEETFTVKTGGGGRHFFFKYDSDFNTGARILPLTDVRSKGGYVVAAPSVSQKGAYEVLKDVDVVKMTDETKTKLLGDSVWDSRLSGQTKEYQKLDISASLGISQGSRNDTLHKLACSLLNHHTDAEAWQLTMGANMTYSPPLPENEVRSLFEQAKKFVAEHPKTEWVPPAKEWGPAKKELPPAAGIASEVALDKLPVEILHASVVAARQSIDTGIVYATEMKPFDDVLLGGFSPGDLVVVAGKSGHGKTTLIQDWSVTFAMGGKERKQPALPGLWFSYEVLPRPLWGKFETMGADVNVPLYLPSFNESRDIEWVEKMIIKGIEEKGIRVAAIDHLGFLRPPKGNYANAADAITHTVRQLKEIAVRYGIIVMLPVHVRKNVGKNPDLDDIKDASGIPQEADTVFFISRTKGKGGLYDESAQMWLIKNRKTGASASAVFDFRFGRYFYNEELTATLDSAAEAVSDFDAK